MMQLRGLVLFLLFLPGGAHRRIRIDDSHHDALEDTLANGLEVSAAAREALIPEGLGVHRSSRAGGIQAYAEPPGDRLRFGRTTIGAGASGRARVSLQADDEAEPPAEPTAGAQEPAIDVESETVAEEPEPTLAAALAEEEEEEDDAVVDESSHAIAKEALKSVVYEGLAGARPDKAVVMELLLALEAENPTPSPAKSTLLNGKWKFLYATGASPGLKALMLALKGATSAPKSPSGADLVNVADTFLTIKAEQPRATAEVKLRILSFKNTVKLTSQLVAVSAKRLVETYESAASDYMNLKLPFLSPVEYTRSLVISYLDKDMLVVRDGDGRPDVLTRVDEGGVADDAPGAS